MAAELIPANNTLVRRFPAAFYCRITDTTGGITVVQTEWYIDDVPYTEFRSGSVTVSEGAQTNLTINFLFVSFRPVIVSCRTSFFPDISVGTFQAG